MNIASIILAAQVYFLVSIITSSYYDNLYEQYSIHIPHRLLIVCFLLCSTGPVVLESPQEDGFVSLNAPFWVTHLSRPMIIIYLLLDILLPLPW